MEIFCLEEFKDEVERLKKNNSYADLEKEIIEHFFDKPINELKSGDLLNNSDDKPYIKKRLNGRGGFRVYFLLIIIKDCLYLMYVHPKSGKYGSDNITKEARNGFLRKVIDCIKSKPEALFEVKKDSTNTKLMFKPKDTKILST